MERPAKMNVIRSGQLGQTCDDSKYWKPVQFFDDDI